MLGRKSLSQVATSSPPPSRTLWNWGIQTIANNSLGQNSPVQVGSLTQWIDSAVAVIPAFGWEVFAIKDDRTLWKWGIGVNEQQVGTDSNWSRVVGGGNFALGLKTDGTLWAWGDNTNGQLGLNDTTSRSSPVQVGSDTTWSSGATGQSTLCIKTDGTLWAWGDNSLGSLGLNDITNRSSPVQVGSLTNWSQVSTGQSTLAANVAAIKTDGTLWGWGGSGGNRGHTGTNISGNRSSPVQIGTDTNWAFVHAVAGAYAIKTTGTLWGWGGTTTRQFWYGANRSTPIQLGSSTNWVSVYTANSLYAVALRS